MVAILASATWRKCGAKVAVRRVAARTVARCAKPVLAGCMLLLAVAASGCSTINFAYTMGPTALGLMADNYLDLDGEQETLLKERMLALRESNRTGQLADYAKLLLEVRTRAAGKVTPEDIAWLVSEARRHWKVMGTRVAGEIADLAPRLNPDNIAALKKKLARNNAEYTKETIEATPEKQRERRFERVLENAERWYGSYDDAQQARIRALTDALPMNPRLVLEDRVRRQNAFVAVLAGVIDKSITRADAEPRLATLLTELETGRAAEYQTYAAHYLKQSLALTAEISNLANAGQRDTAQRRFKRWADDMAALAARKEP